MSIKMKDPNLSTSTFEIAQFERLIGLVLPRPYRDFLSMTNGGVPEHSYFPVDGMLGNTGASLHVFLGIGAPFTSEDLAATFSQLRHILPIGMVPIACTAGEDFVLLDLRTKERVVFWDHRHAWSTGEWREQDLYPVADSFDELLGLLRMTPY